MPCCTQKEKVKFSAAYAGNHSWRNQVGKIMVGWIHGRRLRAFQAKRRRITPAHARGVMCGCGECHVDNALCMSVARGTRGNMPNGGGNVIKYAPRAARQAAGENAARRTRLPTRTCLSCRRCCAIVFTMRKKPPHHRIRLLNAGGRKRECRQQRTSFSPCPSTPFVPYQPRHTTTGIFVYTML